MILVRPATIEDAETITALIHETFGARPILDPPATALDETAATVGARIAAHGGLVAELDGVPVGSLLFDRGGWLLGLRRVCVLAAVREHGVAHRMTDAAAALAVEAGLGGLVLEARAELPDTVAFWRRQEYVEVAREGTRLRMVRPLPQTVSLPTLEATRDWGRALGKQLRAGDLLVLTGDLGAGKTTLTQSIAESLDVHGEVTSPTFVIARTHRARAAGPQLVHVDAYRLGDSVELDDLDLDTDLDESVTIVEWGAGLAEDLSEDYLEIALTADAEGVRTAVVTRVGVRWAEVDLSC